jgi:PAS domain S-box-containing protein
MNSSNAGMQAHLNEDADPLRLLVNAVTEYAIYTLDAEGKVASWNTGAERIKGYKAEEILGQPFRNFFPEEEKAKGRPEALLETARKEGLAKDAGWRVRKDGSRFLAEAVISPIYDKDGKLRGFAKVTRDVTDRKAMRDLQALNDRLAESEKKLRALAEEVESSRNRLDIILNGVDNAITAQDATGRLVFANAAAANNLGYATTEALLNAPPSRGHGQVPRIGRKRRTFSVGENAGKACSPGHKRASRRFALPRTGDRGRTLVLGQIHPGS